MDSFNTPSRLRKVALIYSLLLVLCGIGYARYSNYMLDGDAVAFMDIADAMHAHDLAHVVNGYWNPAYAGALLVGELVTHPSRWKELQTFYLVNWVIFVLNIGACWYFVRSMVMVRERREDDPTTAPALSHMALLLTSLALLFASFQRELLLSAVRADALLLLFFLMAASFLMRLESGGRFLFYPLLGAALGLAYLTKSFAFLPSGFLMTAMMIYGLTRKGVERKRIVTGVLAAGVVFLALAGPYILAISKQRGRLTTGESARLNYAFFVDQTGRWHEWHSGDMGHAKADFKHHEELLLDKPPVYSYDQHAIGTYPLWFDPSYWTDTMKPQFYLKGHLQRLARCSALLLRFILGHGEAFAVFAILLFTGCFLGRRRGQWLPLAPVAAWGLLMFAIYFPIDLQDRYLTGPLLLLVLPLLAMLRRPASGYRGEVATGVALTLAALVLVTAISDLGERRRMLSGARYPSGAYSKEIYPAAAGLAALGINPGQAVACFGDTACYVDHYWARLAQTPIRAEIEVPDASDPGAFWKRLPDQQQVLDALRARHISAVVGYFAPAEREPDGWKKLGTSDFYALPLAEPPSGP
jgi:hypothetical protein